MFMKIKTNYVVANYETKEGPKKFWTSLLFLFGYLCMFGLWQKLGKQIRAPVDLFTLSWNTHISYVAYYLGEKRNKKRNLSNLVRGCGNWIVVTSIFIARSQSYVKVHTQQVCVKLIIFSLSFSNIISIKEIPISTWISVESTLL